MRVVFDTNILVLSFHGEPASNIIDAALSEFPMEQLSFFYSDDTMREYRTVLVGLSEKNPAVFYQATVEQLLAAIRQHGNHVHPIITLTTDDKDACTHDPDNRFLECAIEAEADYVITVNTEHFPATYQLPNKVIRRVSPGQFEHILFSD